MTNPHGKVYLVGAGPGDPGLLTLRGAECLRLADVVLYDYLASPELLTHVRADAERICLGRHGHGRLMSQTEINEAMVRHAKNGRTVVRLKGGDPAIFARLAEELAALNAAGVPYEIVPGVTAAQAASSHASIPLTDRDEASCVAFVTGQERHDQVVRRLARLRRPRQVSRHARVLHGRYDRRRLEPALIDHGKRADTPVAIVRRCSLPDQQTFFTTLGELGETVRTKKLRPPAVVIVGDVAKERDVSNWFTTRPLFGRTVLITRPEHQSDDLAARLQNLGANVLRQPAIEIGPPTDWTPVDRAIERLPEFDWLVFSSSNGVEYFLGRLLALRTRHAPFGQRATRRDRPGHGGRARRVPSQGRPPTRHLSSRVVGRSACTARTRQEDSAGSRESRSRSAGRNADRRRCNRRASRRLRKPRRCKPPTKISLALSPPETSTSQP